MEEWLRKEKKMSPDKNTFNTAAIVAYRPATLKHNAHGWSIEYHAMDPASGKLKRHAMKLNVLRKQYTRLADFRAHCNSMVCQINARLAGGWTPFGESQNARMLTPIATAAEAYLNEKQAELRPDTVVNYRSFCKTLVEWAEKESPGMPVGLFNKVLAVRFLDSLFDKGLRGRSWNNRLKQGRAFMGWAVDKCYAKENPFALIKPKRQEPKRRVLIPKATRQRIAEYWGERNPAYLVLCHLVFSSLIRPKEAWRLTVGDIHLDEGYIFISESDAKTHYPRFASLTPQLRESLAAMTYGHSPEERLFGTRYRTGTKAIAYSRFRKDWDRMRTDLKLPAEMQLYSLRDTGINEMLKSGIDPLTVMQHADHHDLSMTTRYANHADPNLVRTISERAPRF